MVPDYIDKWATKIKSILMVDQDHADETVVLQMVKMNMVFFFSLCLPKIWTKINYIM